MTVYVITKALPMNEEKFVDVVATKKDADKLIRLQYPNARVDNDWIPGVSLYYCKEKSGIGDCFTYYVKKKEL